MDTTDFRKRLQAIIDWADLALSNPGEFNGHGVRLLDGPVFDAARQSLGGEGNKAVHEFLDTARDVVREALSFDLELGRDTTKAGRALDEIDQARAILRHR